jgi:spore coat polysaccharide biosynthesis protein SpsF (cytidylyltransferase family)/aryl-alcohol dehydrogenase-like predicted oxidoreductase
MRKIRIIIQARTSSKRLPAKVLLPIGGYPLAVLCAKRLGNTGCEVVLATSDHQSDDILTKISKQAGIRVFRGSLENVLKRFIDCIADLEDDDIIVRATADNPLPDGNFVDILVKKFLSSDLDYLGTNSPSDGLPYGLSAEVFTVGAFRERVKLDVTAIDCEHVTLGMRVSGKKVKLLMRGEIIPDDYANARCTVDTLDEFLEMVTVLDLNAESVQTPWHVYLKRLPLCDPLLFKDIILGTAQFGMDYGITNQKGMPTTRDAQDIIESALALGIRSFDTARAYGVSEARLGLTLSNNQKNVVKVMTKLQPMTRLKDDVCNDNIAEFLNASIYHSCHALGRSKLDVLYFHQSADIFRWSGIAIDHVQRLIEDGVVGEIGASVYTVNEALECINDVRIRHLQIPFNMLDTRWSSDVFQNAIAGRPDLHIYARSVFLQGVLVNPSSAWPLWATERDQVSNSIASLVHTLGRRSSVDLCISYVRAFPWITGLVLGIDSLEQLTDITECARIAPLTPNEVSLVRNELGDVQPRLLNPARW